MCCTPHFCDIVSQCHIRCTHDWCWSSGGWGFSGWSALLGHKRSFKQQYCWIMGRCISSHTKWHTQEMCSHHSLQLVRSNISCWPCVCASSLFVLGVLEWLWAKFANCSRWLLLFLFGAHEGYSAAFSIDLMDEAARLLRAEEARKEQVSFYCWTWAVLKMSRSLGSVMCFMENRWTSGRKQKATREDTWNFALS